MLANKNLNEVRIKKRIDEIYRTNKVLDSKNQEYDIRGTSISKEEGVFIQSIIENNNISRTIEIGCAYGLSSLFICLGLSKKKSKHHLIIDPFQSSHGKNIGINNLESSDIDYYEILEEFSEFALPKLLKDGNKFDFGFIDGWHTFDHTLIDFFYLNKMLTIGGIIVIDDVTYPSINKFMGYLSQYPCYEVIGKVDIFSPRRELENILIYPIRLISYILPFCISSRIFSGFITQKNRKFNLNTSMIALKKIKEDERSYDWFKQF